MIKKLAINFSTSFGIGYFTKFPGTVASFITLFPVWFIKENFSIETLIVVIFVYSIFALVFAKIVTKEIKDKDPRYIISDEHIGQAISLIYSNQKLSEYLIAFLLFRFFDIVKPFPINLFDNLKNSYGILLDDIIAGLITLIIFFIYYEFKFIS